VSWLSWRKGAAAYLPAEDEERIVTAIREAEKRTSGEIRVYAESRCQYVNAIDRAAELFFGLQMERTQYRNAVLVYVAILDRQFALFADQGIYQEMGKEYWEREVLLTLESFKKQEFADGIVTVVQDIGEALANHFPYNEHTDKNELPDNIIFGK
jgi:uncharacterized membrane protein